MEDYPQLHDYFKEKKKQNIRQVEKRINTVSSSVDNELDMELQIEKNQILYSELLTQKLMNKKF